MNSEDNDVVLASKKDIQDMLKYVMIPSYSISSPSLQGLQSTFNRPFVESDTDRIRTVREQTVNVRKWVRDKMGGGFAESGAARTQSTE